MKTSTKRKLVKKVAAAEAAVTTAALSVQSAFAAPPSGVDTTAYNGVLDIVFWVVLIAVAAAGGIPSLIKIVQGQTDEDTRARNAGIAGLVITGAVLGAVAAVKALLF